MKNLIIAFFLFSIVSLNTSCKKESINQSTIEPVAKSNVILTSNGYLKFPTQQSIIEFGQKLMNPNKKQDALAELTRMGFKNRGLNASVTGRDPNSIYSLIFDENGMLEVDNIIMKITDDDKFIYTLKEELASPDAYAKLLQEIYDGFKMNKINVERKLEEDFSLIDFTSENPFGKLEELYSGAGKRHMFGSQQHTYNVVDPAFYNLYGTCTQCTNTYSYTTTYIFWIGFNSTPEYTGQNCVTVPTCK